MHRSGTSALTRTLGLRGAALPRRLLPAAPDNATGVWEPREIVAIHDELLAAAGSSWDDVGEFPPAWFASDSARLFKQRLVAALRSDFGQAPLFVVKDPRICRLVPLWLMVLAEFGAAPLFVIPVRHPFEVAASLARRNGFSEAKALSLWLGHFLSVERDTRGFPRSFVAYDSAIGGKSSIGSPAISKFLGHAGRSLSIWRSIFFCPTSIATIGVAIKPCQRRQTRRQC